LILGPQARSLQVRALKYDVWFWTTRSWPAELVFDLETISAARAYPVDSRLPKYQADHMSTYYFVAFESRSKPAHIAPGDPIYREYGLANFFRQFELNEKVDQSKISAEFNHGVLTLNLPKAQEAKPRKIDVKVA
jgi:Hsp20/alpha crystallin family